MSNNKLLLSHFGRFLSSRTTGRLVREQIVASIAGGASRVEVDFQDVAAASDSFTDEAFGVIVASLGKDWFRRHVTFVNVPPDDREELLGVLRRRVSSAPAPALHA